MFLYWRKRGAYELEALPGDLAELGLGAVERFSWSSSLDIIEDLRGRCGLWPQGNPDSLSAQILGPTPCHAGGGGRSPSRGHPWRDGGRSAGHGALHWGWACSSWPLMAQANSGLQSWALTASHLGNQASQVLGAVLWDDSF